MNQENQNENVDAQAEQQLDALLQGWSDANVADPGDVELAKEKTLAAWHAERCSEIPAVVRLSTSKSKSPLIWARVASLAVGILILGFATQHFFQNRSGKTSQLAQIESKALHAAELNSDSQLEKLAHFINLFGNQLTAVAELDDEIEISMASPKPNELQEFLAIQLVLLSRDSNSPQTDWKVEHRVRVLARSEQRVDIESETSSCSLWAMPIDQDLISIDVNFRLSGNNQVNFTANELQQSRVPKQIRSITQPGKEYRLYQTGSRLRTPQIDSASCQLMRALCLNESFASERVTQ